MPAPKGNKFGYGNSNSGRPNTWTPEIIEKEAELLIEWAKNEDAVVLREFAPLRGYPCKYMYRWSDKNEPSFNEAFCHAFNFARDLIGTRREKITMEKSVQRDLPLYYDALFELERDEAEFRSKLRQKENTEACPADVANMAKALAEATAKIAELEKKLAD